MDDDLLKASRNIFSELQTRTMLRTGANISIMIEQFAAKRHPGNVEIEEFVEEAQSLIQEYMRTEALGKAIKNPSD